MTKYDVVVIGAGINGLTAAADLAKAGKRVLVVDQRHVVGGANVTEELIEGFRFDTLIDSGAPESVTTLGAQPLTLWRDQQRTIAAIRAASARDADAWPAFAARMSRFAGFLATLYQQPALRPMASGTTELLSMAQLGRKLRGLGKQDMVELLRVLPMSVMELLDDTFENDALKATIGAQGIQNLHQGPRSAGTTYVLLHHHVGQSQFRLHTRARGHVEDVAGSARAAGAEILLGTRVRAVRTRDYRATGVVLADGQEIDADIVVSTADIKHTIIDLTDVAQLDPEFVHTVKNVRARGVTARVHFALNGLPRFAGVSDEALSGVLSIAPSLTYIERAYDAIKYGKLSERPYLELRIPSLRDPGLCSQGKQVMSVSVQYVPPNEKRDAIRDVVVKTISEQAPRFADLIQHVRVITPEDMAEYGLPEGCLDHAELALDQILFMRPVPECARHETPIAGLYVCGAGTHPGRIIAGGSGRLAARNVLSSK